MPIPESDNMKVFYMILLIAIIVGVAYILIHLLALIVLGVIIFLIFFRNTSDYQYQRKR